MAYPGTISLRPEVVADVLVDVGKSLNSHEFRKQIWICGHRVANLPPMQIAAWRVRGETRGQAHVVVVDPWYMSKIVRDSLEILDIGHADEHETSMMLYKFPKLVQMKEAVKGPPETRKFSSERGDQTTFVPGVPMDLKRRTIKSGGTLGDATLVTKEKGRKLHSALVNNIVTLVRELRKGVS